MQKNRFKLGPLPNKKLPKFMGGAGQRKSGSAQLVQAHTNPREKTEKTIGKKISHVMTALIHTS